MALSQKRNNARLTPPPLNKPTTQGHTQAKPDPGSFHPFDFLKKSVI
jgi:hypothetical protein